MKRKCNYANCGRSYEAMRPTSKFCSSNCRARNHQTAPRPVSSRPKKAAPADTSIGSAATSSKDGEPNSLVTATRKELEAAGVADTMMGQQALRIAQQMSGFETAGGMAALSKELSRVMAEAVRTAPPLVADPVDELAKRREEKLAAG
jgi:hypothetical protein